MLSVGFRISVVPATPSSRMIFLTTISSGPLWAPSILVDSTNLSHLYDEDERHRRYDGTWEYEADNGWRSAWDAASFLSLTGNTRGSLARIGSGLITGDKSHA
jgi:hypothetical protein